MIHTLANESKSFANADDSPDDYKLDQVVKILKNGRRKTDLNMIDTEHVLSNKDERALVYDIADLFIICVAVDKPHSLEKIN